MRPEGHLAEAYWRMRLGELGAACCISEPAGEADRIREAFDLLMLAPSGLLARLSHTASEKSIKAMLAAGAFESAALTLLPQGAGYMLSRGASGEHLASIFLAHSECEMTANGSTAALALVAALTTELSHGQTAGALHASSLN